MKTIRIYLVLIGYLTALLLIACNQNIEYDAVEGESNIQQTQSNAIDQESTVDVPNESPQPTTNPLAMNAEQNLLEAEIPENPTAQQEDNDSVVEESTVEVSEQTSNMLQVEATPTVNVTITATTELSANLNTESTNDTFDMNSPTQLLHMYIPQEAYVQFDYGKSLEFDFTNNELYPFSFLDFSERDFLGEVNIDFEIPQLFSFSNHSNKIAFWSQGKLWLSDIGLENLQHIDYNETINIENTNAAKLIWSPDDLHLILHTDDLSVPNLIYHQNENRIEQWPYICDRLGLSSHSGQVAMWCASEKNDSRFAVIEWGGEIWFSDHPPEIELVKNEVYSMPLWDWASDGQTIAYFNQDDVTGSLTIIDIQGNSIMSLPDIPWWQNSSVEEARLSVPTQLLHWSANGEYLLLWGNKLADDSCPPHTDTFAPLPNPVYEIPCWQLIDGESGALIWSWTDFVTLLDNEESDTWQVWEAAISSDGTILSFFIKPLGSGRLGVYNVETLDLQVWQSPAAKAMYWQIP